MQELKHKSITEKIGAMNKESVSSGNHFKSVIQISYDIVSAHGGEIKVESKEIEGTEFVIHLPVVRITD